MTALIALTTVIGLALALLTAAAPPTAAAAVDLLSQGRPVTASSTENESTPASAAVDGNTGTRWSSAFGDPQWLSVDLGATATISQVVLRWESAYGRAFQIQTSDNGTSWTTIHSTTTSTGGVQTLDVDGNGRYVRVHGTRRGTAYGYSLWEFQVYGSGGGTPPGNGIPDPTTASLEAANGPLNTATYTVPSPTGYGSGTVTYPTDSGSYPGVVLMPGYQGTQQNLQWLAPRLASWGFVVINVGTNTLTDDPESRGRQITAAGTQLLALGGATGNPISGKVNGTLGAVGHSMGGGGVMAALRDDSRFRAGVPTAPYLPNTNFSAVTEPTFFLTCQSDPVAHGNTYALPWYNSMSQAEKLYIEVPGDHLCPMTGSGNKAKQGKWIVSFLSHWLRADTRFSPFLCGPVRDADKNNTSLVTRWMDTCQF
ncbi:discoidin domain-containing protein [Streptomyces europaeiscabiei]|uniref:Discoidin domain-containing protein n=1 Tax=Streptomyces europaeiscabiei TaxID=146819 RepID=A0AAJ2UPN4_9ACTN|nr:discoidin domain-containing protein [Streptomyces europaeiscabiei]MDX3134101.1 discoidin domain-containing protein [Streptomyces europaeiscabiei]